MLGAHGKRINEESSLNGLNAEMFEHFEPSIFQPSRYDYKHLCVPDFSVRQLLSAADGKKTAILMIHKYIRPLL